MDDAVKWVAIAVIAWLAWGWLRNGISATTTVGPAGWGSGFIGPGNGMLPAYPPVNYRGLPLFASYSPNGFSFAFGG